MTARRLIAGFTLAIATSAATDTQSPQPVIALTDAEVQAAIQEGTARRRRNTRAADEPGL